MGKSVSTSVLLKSDQLSCDNPFITPHHSIFKTLARSKVLNAAIIVSIIAHAAFLIKVNFYPATSDNADNGHSLVVSLNRVTPEAPPVPDKVVEEKIIDPEPVKESEPENVIKEDIQPEKVIKAKQEKVPEIAKKPEKTIEPVKKETEVDKVATQAPAQSISTAVNNQQIKESYIQQLAKHINEYKFYPRAARRRHIEGQVNVSFDLLMNGNIINLHVHSGPVILQKAAMEAIHSALPMPQRPEELLALDTMKIEYAMQYSLK